MNIVQKIIIFSIDSRFWKKSGKFPGGTPRDEIPGNLQILKSANLRHSEITARSFLNL